MVTAKETLAKTLPDIKQFKRRVYFDLQFEGGTVSDGGKSVAEQ